MGQVRKKPDRLAEKLFAIRLKLGISQSQLTKLLDFDKGAARISEYESGKREPDLMTLLKYSKLARVSLEVLADDTRELRFSKTWKIPKHVRALLMQQRLVSVAELTQSRTNRIVR